MRNVIFVLAILLGGCHFGPPKFNKPTTVTLVNHTSHTKNCTDDEYGCTQTHHKLWFHEDSTGEKFFFHGWTQSRNGETRLNERFKIGDQFSTTKDEEIRGVLSLCTRIDFQNPFAQWCFIKGCNGSFKLFECGKYGGTFD